MGFMFALRETMRLSPGALLFAGVPCARWIWLYMNVWSFFGGIMFNVFHGPETVSKDVQPVLELEQQHFWKPTKWGSWETLSRSLIACIQALLQVLYFFVFGYNWTKLGMDFLLYTPASPFNPWWRKPLAKTRQIKLQHLDTPRCPSYTKTAIFDIWILLVGQITVDFFSWESYYVCGDVFPEIPLVPRQSLVARQGVDFVLKGNIIAARFALLCLVSIVLKAHHVVSWLNRT